VSEQTRLSRKVIPMSHLAPKDRMWSNGPTIYLIFHF